MFPVGELVEERMTFQTKGDIKRDDSQRRFLAQHSFATLLQHCFEWQQHCSNIATLFCAKNRRCESSRVTLTQAFTVSVTLLLGPHISSSLQKLFNYKEKRV